MKFSCVFIVVALAMTMMQSTPIYEQCELDDWVITNTTLQWLKKTKNIAAVIIKNNDADNQVYKIHITIDGCTNRTNCIGESKVQIGNVDCNVPDMSDLCEVAEKVEQLEKEEEWLTNQGLLNGELYNTIHCLYTSLNENED